MQAAGNPSCMVHAGVDHVVNYELPHNAEDEPEQCKLPAFTSEEDFVICA